MIQNGYERAINGLLGAMARPRYLSGVGSLDSVAAISLEQIEIDDEIMGYLLYAIEERPWDAEALDVDAMVEGSSGATSWEFAKRASICVARPARPRSPIMAAFRNG